MRVEKETIYQVKDEAKQDKNIEIDPEFLRRIQIVAEVVGGDFNMKIEIGKPGGGSFFNGLERKITLDPLHIKENPESAVFVSAHEGGHRAITRGPHEMGLKDEKINEVSSELGFAFGFNCCEDPADNNWVEKKFTGLEQDIDNIYNKMLEKENIPLGMDHPEVKQTVAMLGYVPKFVYFGSEIIRYWYQSRFSENLNNEIKNALERVKNDCQAYFESIPSAQKTEKETIEMARERFLNFYQNIWPEMKKIVEMDINDEKLRQMANEMMDDLLKKTGKKSKKELEDSVSQGRKQLEDEIDKTRKDSKETGKEEEQTGKEIEDLKEKLKNAQGEEKKNLEKKLQEKEGKKEQNKKKQEELEKGLEQMEQQKEGGNNPIPMDQLSQNLKDKLQEIFDSLPEEKKKELEQQARESLEKLEDKLNQETEGKLNIDKIESHQEKMDQLEKEKVETEKTRKEREEIEKARKKTEEKIEKEMSEYDEYYQQVKPMIEELYDELKKVFLPQRHPRWKKGYPSGSRLDLLKVMQFEADKSKHTEIWERKTIPQKVDYKFMMLVDMSGSMGPKCDYVKIKETFKGLIVLTEVLNRLGIDNEIIGFSGNSGIKIYKQLKDGLDKETRNKIDKIIHQCGGGTPTAKATEFASEELEKNKGKDNFLITLTDGQPDSGDALKKIIEQVRKNTKQKLVGLGLGPDTNFVEEFYPAAKGDIEVEQLPKLLSQLLEDMIKNPSKY